MIIIIVIYLKPLRFDFFLSSCLLDFYVKGNGEISGDII